MKTKPITLILTLLFCLSGSVFAEEGKKDNVKFKAASHRIDRYRDFIQNGKAIKTVNAERLSEVKSQLNKIKRQSIDLGKIWAYEDLKRTDNVGGLLNPYPNFKYKTLQIKPLTISDGLILFEYQLKRRPSGGSLNRIGLGFGPRGPKLSPYIKIKAVLNHPNPDDFKIGEKYFISVSNSNCRIRYKVNKNGVESVRHHDLFDYGVPSKGEKVD